MWKTVTIGAMALLMAACTTVTTDVDKQADFASYKTFDFGTQNDAPASIDGRRIEQGLAAQLESKGLSRVTSGGIYTFITISLRSRSWYRLVLLLASVMDGTALV